MQSKYLLKRDGRYYFRLRVPLDLRRWFAPREEIKKSLKTNSYNDAKNLVRVWIYRGERLFTQLRSAMLSDDQIKQLVADYLDETLIESEEMRLGRGCLYADDGEGEHGTSVIDTHLTLLSDRVENLARGEYEAVSNVADYLLEKAGITVEKDSREYQKLCRETLQVVIEAMKIETERMKGNYDNWYDRRSHPSVALTTSSPSPAMLAPSREKPGVILSTAIREYVEEHSAGENWTKKTRAESEGIYKLLVGIVGDRDTRELDYKTLADFRGALTRYPSNANKKKEYRGKSVREILQMEIAKPLSVSSVNKHIIRVGAFLKWCVKRGYVEANFAEGLTIAKRNTKEEEEREAYSQEDLQRLIKSPLYTTEKAKRRPECFWIPLIGLYSGMRLNEICQLHLEDIREEQGILCFDVNEKGDKRLKNASSKRVVPVHPILLDFGFREYVEVLRADGKVRLWENLKKKRDGYAQDFGRWFQRFNRRYVTASRKRVFHSFRHTLADNLKQRQVEGVTIAEILGHSHGSITLSRYGKGYGPEILLNALLQLGYGIEDDLKGIPAFRP
ncbi:site-specific integrase [Candidatus Deferrimicrobium sp.]|uniref:site-specific integrase n=1 Tax=Candidatus Deferrimicrobium sp. TaxID=3060586 RepID=UPI00271CCE09|nr:site-specific integrase [Candidatus Deferrimicrobium sp.]MDO8738007.1 site-specific integrase [Candidatus Deferrimicrobium sp.]